MDGKLTWLYAPRRMLFGCGSVKAVGEEVIRLGGKRVLIVTDPGVLSAGLVDRVLESLKAKDLEVDVFSEVQANPTSENVSDGLSMLGKGGAPVVVGVGGGSAIDAGKMIAALATNGGEVRDYDGVDLLPKRMLPYIAVNTTAGTGSEVSRAAVITDTERKWKMQIVTERVTPDVAIDDPLMTVSLPQAATAQTGMDALTHAIEGLVGRNDSYLTDGLALTAIDLISKNLRIAYADGGNVDARTKVMYGQAAAGLAFTNAGVGNVHAMAHQL
ncbi:MAG: iron-containing alcohol dehydrogenase, partial [Deltaproteobacteria bacterium]|nr:iron-containing alcohol dehydrogenase [Deltaproteobacteria bacterium]